MLLSIITLVYKAEQYIERCVRSLMEQTMKENIEFIFINDCTPDASMKILRKIVNEYPQRKNQIRIIENETNLGVSATRKIGIEAANGKYIGWCDSDDWVDTTMYQTLYEATQNGRTDIVVTNFINETKDCSKNVMISMCTSPQECIEKMWMGFYFPGALWQQITRKELIRFGMKQITQVNYAEDLYSLLLAYYNASTIAYIDKYLYHYNCNNEVSLIHNVAFNKRAWKAHENNLKLVTEILYNNGGKSRYHVTCNVLKYKFKNFYKSAFSNIYEFYYVFPECYKDVNTFLFTPPKPLINRIKTYLSYNIFLLFCLFHSKEFCHKV